MCILFFTPNFSIKGSKLMKFKEITVDTTREGSELVADILCELGSDGVSIFDSEDLKDVLKSNIQWDYVEEHLLVKNEVVRVKGYFDEKAELSEILSYRLDELKKNSKLRLGSLEESVSIIDDADWVNEWRKYYKPIKIGDVVIVPSWIKYERNGSERIVRMEPGMAFGTGTHESTHMCIELLTSLDPTGKTVIDVGTGSGILGITAAVMGAKEVYMYDIDDIAVKAAKENARLNGVEEKTFVENADLLNKNSGKGDIVLANITADVLISLSESLTANIRDDAKIILSGIIKSRRNDVIKAYESRGYNIVKFIEEGEWNALLLEKNHGN